MSASFQLAVKAMMIPAANVAKFWTANPKASPTRLLTVDASLDSLAPIAPLHKSSTRKHTKRSKRYDVDIINFLRI